MYERDSGMKDLIRINEEDNCAVALRLLKKGDVVSAGNARIEALEEIPAGHKIAIQTIAQGSAVVKYGYRIGTAKEEIRAGMWIHTHNLQTGLGELLEYQYDPIPLQKLPEGSAYFRGYRRQDGRVGIRNEIWIVPTVGCVNSIATALAARMNGKIHGSVDAVVAFPHPYGCSQMGEDQEHTRLILTDLIKHPNVGGALVLGLGCENSNISVLKEYLGQIDEKRIRFLECQEVEDEMKVGSGMIRELIDQAAADERENTPVSSLVVGMKCGGSDGFSGITANPLVGRFSDLLIAKGGTTILTEVPEMFGAETILMNRCENRDLFEKTVDLINSYKQYFKDHHQTIYENPSPGNKMGGISTLEDKSLGCVQKSGIAPVRGVLTYGGTVTEKGLNLLAAPGNDLVAATALAAAGAQLILFTTGRGTPFACPVPTVKISSNTRLASRKKNWIDFDAGVLTGNSETSAVAKELFEYVMQVASGRKVCSEEAGFHDMAIFKQGVTL